MRRAPGRSPCVVFAGGGTGGHLFPGIAVAEELRRRHPDWKLHFVGTARGIEVRQVPRYGFALHLLPVRALRGQGVTKSLLGLGALPQAGWAALRLIHRLRPQVAVGVGGYAAGPAMVAARALGSRCVVMEQNAYAGLTNRLLARLAHRVLLSLPNAQLTGRKSQLLGNPVRASLVALRDLPAPPLPATFSAQRPLKILAFGGSQGARGINQAMLALARGVQAQGWPVSAIHQTGVGALSQVTQAYAEMGANWVRPLPFVDDMAKALADADLLLCRAGASTLAEATVVGRACLLVPYPHAADDHQTANARVLQAAGAARCLPESTLTAEAILGQVGALLAAPNQLATMRARAHALGRPEATHAIADVIEKEVQGVSQ